MTDKENMATDSKGQEPSGRKTPPPTMPVMTFATFVVSLNHSALVHLGKIADPTTGNQAKNLELAKQTIDIIAMLEEKTKGNLTGEEERMLKGLLYDLRMGYVSESQ